MILPIYLSGCRLYLLILKEDTFKVIDSFEYRFPYISNYTDSFITQKKLLEAVSSLTKTDKLKRDDLLVISDEQEINNIFADYMVSDITSHVPFLLCMLGQYSQSDAVSLEKDDANHLVTQIYLNDEIDEGVRLKIDTKKIKEFIVSHIKNLKVISDIVVCNYSHSDSYKKKIKDVFISELALIIENPKALGITFDFGYKRFLRYAFLVNKKVDIKEEPDLKILFVPNAFDVNYSIIDESSKDQVQNKHMEIKSNTINSIEASGNHFIKLKVTGNKVKFSGEFQPGASGLVIYSKGQ